MAEPGSWFRELSRGSSLPVHVGPVAAAEGQWVSAIDDPEPTRQEHDDFYRAAADRLDALLEEHHLAGATYIRGDDFGTRSQEMYAYPERFIGHVTVLVRAVLLVQACLREHPRWRVIFPLGEGAHVAIAIYPTRIFHGAHALDGAGLREVLRRFVVQ